MLHTRATLRLAVLPLMAIAACAKTSAPPIQATPVENVETTLMRTELESLLPAPGLKWLVQLRPRQLVEDARLREDWQRVFQSERLKAFVKASGVDPAQIEEMWIAGYPLGTLLLFDGSKTGAMVEQAFRKRALTTRDLTTDSLDSVHITSIVDHRPHALFSVRGDLVAIAEGDLTLVKVVKASFEGRLKETKSALQTKYMQPLANFDRGAPVRAFLLGPFEQATDAVAQGFVTGASSLRHQEGQLELQVEAFGLWDRSQIHTLQNWLDAILTTREMRALGWGFPSVPPTVDCNPNNHGHLPHPELVQCRLVGRWRSADLADALYLITQASLSALTSGEGPPGWNPPLGGSRDASPSTNEEDSP